MNNCFFRKVFFLIMSVLFCYLTGCRNIIGNGTEESEFSNNNDSQTAVLTVVLNSEQSNTRTAVPIVTQQVTYSATASKSGSATVSGTFDENGICTLAITPGTWQINVTGKAEINGNEVLVYASDGRDEIIVKRGGKYTASISVYYVRNPEIKGSVNLKMNVAQATKISYLVVSKTNSNLDGRYNTAEGEIIISNSEVTPGNYSALLSFYDTNGLLILNLWEKINVFSNLETKYWIQSGEPYYQIQEDSSVSFTLSDEIIKDIVSTQFYVKGNGGVLTAAAEDSNSGSWAAPLATISKALNRIELMNDGTQKYTIFIDGTVQISETVDFQKTGYYLLSGLSGSSSDVLQQTNSSSVVNVSDSGTDVTFANMKITGGNATGNGGGICCTSSKITLDSVEISGNEAKLGGGVYLKDSSITCIGKVIIQNNKSEGSDNNLYLESLDVENGLQINGLSDGSKIGISGVKFEDDEYLKVFSSDEPPVNYQDYFISDNGYTVCSSSTGSGKRAALARSQGSVTCKQVYENLEFKTDRHYVRYGKGEDVRFTSFIENNQVALTNWNKKITYTGIDITDKVNSSVSEGDFIVTFPLYFPLGNYYVTVSGIYNGVTYSTTQIIYVSENIPLNEINSIPPKGVYTASTKDDFEKLSEWSRKSKNTFKDYTFILQEDIDLGEDFVPMGNGDEPFEGVFDGNGKTIITSKSSKQEDGDKKYFSPIINYNSGIVQNLNVQINSEQISMEQNCIRYGLIVFCNKENGIVRNCMSSGNLTIKTHWDISGIAVENYGIIENCLNKTNLESINYTDWSGFYERTGGICSINDSGTIKNCVNLGTVFASQTYAYSNSTDTDLNGFVGPIVAINNESAIIQNCYWLKNSAQFNEYGTNELIVLNTIGYKATNNGVYLDGIKGTVTGCGYFTDNTITPGGIDECNAEQNLEYGDNLLKALNSYVDEYNKKIEYENNPLKKWKIGDDGKITLDIEE